MRAPTALVSSMVNELVYVLLRVEVKAAVWTLSQAVQEVAPRNANDIDCWPLTHGAKR